MTTSRLDHPTPAATTTTAGNGSSPDTQRAGAGVSEEKVLPLKWSTTENVKWRVALPERGMGEVPKQILRGLPPEQWERGGIHATRGRMTIKDFVAMMAWHDDNHLDQLRRALDGKP